MNSSSALLVAAAVLSLGTALAAGQPLVVRIRATPSGPAPYVNGKPTAPAIFFVNFDTDEKLRPLELEEIAAAGRHGVNIVSFPVPNPWPRPGEQADFSEGDRRVEAAIKANPKIMVLARIGVGWPPQWWIEEHPDEIMLYADGTRGYASIFSARWRVDARTRLVALVAHLEEKYGDRMVGYHPCAQNTGEWFFEQTWEGKLAGYELCAREAFRAHADAEVPTLEERTRASCGAFRDPVKDGRAIDFDRFANSEMAAAVVGMCRAIKEAAPKKLAVTFYGYHFEIAGTPHGPAATGHLALGELLASPDVDVVCSPVSYLDRGPGGGGYFMAPVDSAQAHGKLWLIEDDTRTHLGTGDTLYGMARCKDARETGGVLARNFAHILTRGAAVWWMDLFGSGWFSGDEIWKGLGQLAQVYRQALGASSAYKPEIAVIVDERSCLYANPSPMVTGILLGEFRKQWYRIGAPVGIWLLDDLLAGKVPKAKMYVFLDLFRLDGGELGALRRQVRRKGVVLVWMYAPGIVRSDRFEPADVGGVVEMRLSETDRGSGKITMRQGGEFDALNQHLSPTFAVDDPKAEPLARYCDGGEVALAAKTVDGCTSVYCGTLQMPASLLRELARRAGVHVYNDQDDVVTAGSGFVALHASSTGHKVLRMPAACQAVDCVTGEKLPRARTFSFDMERGDTRILRILGAK